MIEFFEAPPSVAALALRGARHLIAMLSRKGPYEIEVIFLVDIATERLLLRKFNYEDINDMLKNWVADPIVQSGYGEPIFETSDKIKVLLDKWSTQQYRWAVILKETSENVGQVGFCCYYPEVKIAEIEYCIGRAHWGNGYIPEAIKAIFKYVFNNSDIEKIEAFHRIENSSSGRVLQKVGMSVVPNVKRFESLGKAPDGDICYAITKKQYFQII